MKSGVLLEFSVATGRGIIFCKSMGGNVNVFAEGVRAAGKLSVGDTVLFEPGKIGGIAQATNVSLLEKAPPVPRPAPTAQELKFAARQKQLRLEKDQCRSCEKFMVPRLALRSGQPYKSYCPFCAAEHQDFVVPVQPSLTAKVGGAVAAGGLMGLLGSLLG